MASKKMFPMSLYAEITRSDDEKREVEGYAFVNESVPGEGGVRLKRSAMEAATADYLAWGNLREMHQASAVGTVLEGKWDEKGFFIRAKVVDDVAWKKVQERVYKGFSVGVNPKLMRGKDIEAVDYIETSLVDRPKDADCPIKFIRTAEHAETECEVIDDEKATSEEAAGDPPSTGADEGNPTERSAGLPAYKRSTFAEYQAANEKDSRRSMAFNWLSNSLWDIACADQLSADAREMLARQSLAEFADYVAPLMRASVIVPPEMCRVALGVDAFAAAEKATEKDAEIQRLQTTNTELLALVERAKLTPAEDNPPIMRSAPITGGVPRTFLHEIANGTEGEKKAVALKEEHASIVAALDGEKNEDKRQAGIARMMVIKTELAGLGHKPEEN